MKLICCLALLLSGCMAVIGYYPTEEELAALRRGEDPRANEGARRESTGGQPEAAAPAADEAAPSSGKVLRWIDSATVAIEANSRREVVALAGYSKPADAEEERRAKDRHMDRWTYGKAVTLSYPLRDGQGSTLHRDGEGRLMALLDGLAAGAE